MTFKELVNNPKKLLPTSEKLSSSSVMILVISKK